MWLAALMLGMLALAACGGDDAGNPAVPGETYPLFGGALQRDSSGLSTKDLDYRATDAGAAVFTATASYADVLAYYRDGVTREGWSVARALEMVEGADFVAVLARGPAVVAVNGLTAEEARQQPRLFSDAKVELDLASAGPDTVVILVYYFTCAEDEAALCVNGLLGT